jgi:hypothetical protein
VHRKKVEHTVLLHDCEELDDNQRMKVPLKSRERKGASSRVAGDARIICEKTIAHPRHAKWQFWGYHCTYLGIGD